MNIIIPILLSYYLYLYEDVYGNQSEQSKDLKKYFDLYLTNCTLSIISGVYLGYSIYQIKQIINSHEVLHTKNLTVHTIAFSIYMLSYALTGIAVGLEAWEKISYEQFLVMDDLKFFCSFVTQLIMLYIFHNIESKKKAVMFI